MAVACVWRRVDRRFAAVSEPYAIGIDLGGTEIKAAAFSVADGAVLAKAGGPTRDGERAPGGGPAFVAEVRRLIDGLGCECGGVAARVGLSAPGLADREGRRIAFMPGRMEGLEGLDWGEALGRGRVPVLNDAHAALLGEAWQGAARGFRDVAMLTLGTGVGGAAICGGELLRGAIGRAGHFGHMTVDFEGAPDDCAMPGSLEMAVGNASLAARGGGRFANTHALVAAYGEGDPEAASVWERSLRALAAACASLVNILDPEAIVVGGGIAAAGGYLFEPLERLVREREWQPAGVRVRLLPAALGPWAGAYGAAFHAISNRPDEP